MFEDENEFQEEIEHKHVDMQEGISIELEINEELLKKELTPQKNSFDVIHKKKELQEEINPCIIDDDLTDVFDYDLFDLINAAEKMAGG